MFDLWYGNKAPGVDQTSDVFKHANASGTARHGGVLANREATITICSAPRSPPPVEFQFADCEMRSSIRPISRTWSTIA